LEVSLKNCKFCGKHFAQANALLRHMKLHNNKSNFTCEHCGYMNLPSTVLDYDNLYHNIHKYTDLLNCEVLRSVYLD
jgi:transcription elongation factor Elf1